MAPSVHRGSFSAMHRTSSAHSLYSGVEGLIRRSPGLCAPNATLHILHDLDFSPAHFPPPAGHVRLGVRYHKMQGNAAVLGNDWRFALFLRVSAASSAPTHAPTLPPLAAVHPRAEPGRRLPATHPRTTTPYD